MSIAKNFGRFLGAALVVAANASAENSRKQQESLAEQNEADKWEQRRVDACDAIDRAVETHSSSVTFNRTLAIDLRSEANTRCRNRSEILMRYTEERIVHFEKFGW